ncbi:MAG: hypothetical protein QOI53_2904 [Verrucomicrobiota bacterium]|nr:hypothetical protein [Verrucomicrobiota bacterium]
MARPNGHFRGLKGHESIAQTSAWVYISNENRPEAHKALPSSALLEKHPVRRVGGAEGAAEIVFRKYANSPYLAGSKPGRLAYQVCKASRFTSSPCGLTRRSKLNAEALMAAPFRPLSPISANHFLELFLVHNLNPQLPCFVQFASGILTGQQVAGFFADAGGDPSAISTDQFVKFFARLC